MQTSLSYVEIQPSEPVQSVVILLHGLGADGHDFVPIVPKLKLPASTLFIFPHAPHRPITINQNAEMPGWYDVLEIVAYGKEDDQGILASNEQIQELIVNMTKLVPSEKIYLVGFSQGGAMALYTGLTCNKNLEALPHYLAMCQLEIPLLEISIQTIETLLFLWLMANKILSYHFILANLAITF